MSEKKGTRIISHEVAGALIEFKVDDGSEKGLSTILDVEKLSNEVREAAVVHGLVQRVRDAAAISRDGESGKSASPLEKFNAMKVLVEHYNSGTVAWNLTGGERGPSDEVKVLAQALTKIYTKKTLEELTAWVRKRSKAEVAALCEQENIKPLIAELRAERAKGVDAQGLLAELG